MGLDQYLYLVKASNEEEAIEKIENEDVKEIAHWRKHPNLHGWMKKLYNQRGGFREFNCIELLLTKEDILRLEQDILNDNLPFTMGFYFGTSSDKDKEVDLNSCKSALKAIEKGYFVFYDSCW